MFNKLLAVLTFMTMVAVNALANILPINGISTAAVSDSYPNLFAPAGITFAIWGVIYLLLGIFVVFQFQKNKDRKTEEIMEKIRLLFSVSSIVNATWIFSWHYKLIGISVILMTILLFCLIMISDLAKNLKPKNLLVQIPFGVYFGWITVATIANITVFLVSLGWNGFGISESVWTVLVLMVGMLIGLLRLSKDRNIAYGLVLVWAYFGILYKHTSSNGYNYQYPLVIVFLSLCLISLLVGIWWFCLKKTRNG